MTTDKPVIVLLDDGLFRATTLARWARDLGIAVWWSRNVADFKTFVEDAVHDKRLLMVIMENDLGHKDGKDDSGQDGTDAVEEMTYVGEAPIFIWTHNLPSRSRMLGLAGYKTDGKVYGISYAQNIYETLYQIVSKELSTKMLSSVTIN